MNTLHQYLGKLRKDKKKDSQKIFFLVNISLFLDMSKGFAAETSAPKKKKISNSTLEPQGRLISWSPWPPANFQTRYPAFPFVLTILIIVIAQWYLSLLK